MYVALWTWSAATGALAGCSDDGGEATARSDGGGAGSERPAKDAGAPGCSEHVRRCDIRKTACQEAVAEAVACLRESHSLQPAVRLISEQDYAESVTPSATSPSAELTTRWRNGIGSLGLATDFDPTEIASQRAELVSAAYMHATRDIVVIDRGMPLDDANAVVTLAHEMVHAMQDDEVDIEVWTKRWIAGEDSALATIAVLEGEATHYQLLFGLALGGTRAEDFDWDELYTKWQDETYAMADDDESPYDRAPLRFPYAFGGAFVTRAWIERGRAGIDSLMVRPPRTTYEVLFGKAEGAGDAKRELEAAALPVAPSGYRPVTFSSLGAWHTRSFLRRAGLDPTAALEATKTVAADMLSVLVDPNDETAVAIWRMRQFPDAAQDWADLSIPEAISWTEPSEVFVVAGPEAVREQAHELVWLPVPVNMGRIPPQTPPAMR